MITYKNAKGETKYYASYKSAWNRAVLLNETQNDGSGYWLFEGDMNGWFVFFEPHGNHKHGW